MRRVPGPGQWESARPRQLRTVRSFLMFALGSIWTFVMAVRVVHWFGGPVWLGLLFASVALALAGYYLFRMFPQSSVVRFLRSRRRR